MPNNGEDGEKNMRKQTTVDEKKTPPHGKRGNCSNLKFPGVYKVEHSPHRGGNKIKGFEDGEKNQKLKNNKKRNFLKI